jgi:S1-C subfamily serine protease
MAVRAWLLALVVLLQPTAQPAVTLRIRITIVDAAQQLRPVPRHVLLVSQNPTSAAPQSAVTNSDGVAEIRVRPGNYTVESDRPLIFQGKAYEWMRTLDVPAGQTTTLELSADDAQIEAAPAGPPSEPAAGRMAESASGMLLDWQASVVTIWSPLRRGAGVLFDPRGLILTNQRLAGTEKTLEVQIAANAAGTEGASHPLKVAARVLVADADKNVAILWIDPKTAAGLRPMKLRFTDPAKPLVEKEKLYTINVPMDDEKSLSSGTVKRLSARGLHSDVHVDDDSLGAPLFDAGGEVVAITTPQEETDNNRASDTPAVRIDEARGAIAAAEKTMSQAAAPAATGLPVEGESLFPDDPLRESAARRKGSLMPYRVAAADFDVSVITPLLTFAARHQQGERPDGRERPMDANDMAARDAARRALQDFGNWWDYVRRDPPVVMIRATPKLVEPFWKSVLRGAAQTQGVSLPPMKRMKTGFSRMQVFCGDAEVTPIHPFKIEHRLGATEVVYEGFYVFDPASIGPKCSSVKLTLFSEKAPDKGDTRVVDPRIVQQVWDDFAPYRTERAR